MAGKKKCTKCGHTYPQFFTRCIHCGAKLETDIKKTGNINNYLKTGLVLGVSLILIFLVLPPSVRYSLTSGQNFSEMVPVIFATQTPVIEYTLDQTIANNELQIKINSATDGKAAFGSNKFFIVSLYLNNTRASGNIGISYNDFKVIDSKGADYFPTGIEKTILFNLSPSQPTNAQLNFVIPESVVIKKIQFTFPGTSLFFSDRKVVTFVV
jgi:hypothetical protein